MARVKKILAPTYTELIVPTYKALLALGGSGTNSEIYEQVIKNMKLSDEVVDESHLGSENQTDDDDRSRTLEVGMIITVEPGIYISEEADVPAQYKGIGVRIEDNLLMTEYGNKNLTAAAPKEIDDIENLMKN